MVEECSKCQGQYTLYKYDGKLLCKNCLPNEELKLINEKEDKELVKSIYEKRKNQLDLTFTDKLRVVNMPFGVFILLAILTGGVLGIILYAYVFTGVAAFEGKQRGIYIKKDYGIGKEYD